MLTFYGEKGENSKVLGLNGKHGVAIYGDRKTAREAGFEEEDLEVTLGTDLR